MNGLPEDGWIGTVASRPHSIAEHGSRGAPRPVLVCNKQAPNLCMSAEHGKEIGGHFDRPHALGIALARQVVVAANGDCYLLKAVMLVLYVEVLCGGEPVLGDTQSGRAVPKNDETIGVLIGKRLQQDRVCNAENGGGCPDSNHQRQHCRDGECGVVQQGPEGMAKIEQEAMHGRTRWAMSLLIIANRGGLPRRKIVRCCEPQMHAVSATDRAPPAMSDAACIQGRDCRVAELVVSRGGVDPASEDVSRSGGCHDKVTTSLPRDDKAQGRSV